MAQASNDIRADLEPGTAVDLESRRLREEIAATRAALTEKLEALQGRVAGTVQAVRSAGAQTVAAVKQIVDLKHQVHERPLLMLGTSILAGFALGQLGRGQRGGHAISGVNGNGAAGESQSQRVAPLRPAERHQPGLKNRILDLCDEELGKIQSLAIGAALGRVRDWLTQALPTLAPQINELIDNATCKLGSVPQPACLEASVATRLRSDGLTNIHPDGRPRPQAAERRT